MKELNSLEFVLHFLSLQDGLVTTCALIFILAVCGVYVLVFSSEAQMLTVSDPGGNCAAPMELCMSVRLRGNVSG